MRHYVAVQDEKGRWFYANEGRSRVTGLDGWRATGACTQKPSKKCPHCDGAGAFASERKPECQCTYGYVDDLETVPCQGHATAAEAYEHQKQHRLATDIRFFPAHDQTAKSLKRCESTGCDAFTSGSATVGAYSHWTLCDAHQTREVVEGLYRVGESWES